MCHVLQALDSSIWAMLKRSSNLSRCRPPVPRHYESVRRTFVSHGPSSPNLVSSVDSIRRRYSALFTALFVFGTAAVGYGIYEVYRMMTVWPPALRQDLRDALRRKYNDDFEASEAFFRKAWTTAKRLPPSELAPQPYLKATGIPIALGSMLESMGQLDKAYDVYADALSHLQEAEPKIPLSIDEQLRGVSLASKLAELANTLGRGSDEEEKWLAWAVQVILKNIMATEPTKLDRGGDDGSTDRLGHNVHEHSLHALSLPEWASSGADLAAPFEALGTLYSRMGKIDYALPLLLQATSILIPPPPQTSSPEDRCRGAQTMSAISELIMRVNPTPEGIAQAEAWSRKALDITNATKSKEQQRRKWFGLFGKATDRDDTCDVALAVSLFNIGTLREMAGDKIEAKQFLKHSLEQSKRIGLKEGVVAAEEALRNVDSV